MCGFQTICSRFTGAAKANESAETSVFKVDFPQTVGSSSGEQNAIFLRNRLGINPEMHMY